MSELIPPKDDGLYISEVADHSKYKHHFIRRYIDAFTNSMKNKSWNGLHYIDLFAGAGIEKLKDSGELDWGSPLIAAQYPFSKLHLCELNTEKYSALKSRVCKLKPASQIIQGDANEKVSEIVNDIPERSLSLAFLDPYGLHLEFETLKILSKIRVDLIIFFPDRMDALRNWKAYYLDNPESNLDLFLGSNSGWRNILAKTQQERHSEILRDLYVSRIKEKLGFTHYDFERIETIKGQPLYYLIFCSRSSFAVQLWRRIAEKKPDGQRTFTFED